MRPHFLVLIVLPAFLLAACAQPTDMGSELKVVRSRTLQELPSASGITASEKGFLVNSDNAPYAYVLDAAGAVTDSIPLQHEDARLHEIPKPVKPDYEAACFVPLDGSKHLLLLGSGTMSPHRDSALLIGAGQRKASLRPFYAALIRSGIAASSLNIEAAACSGNRLMLFNRGTNELIAIGADSFLNAVFKAAPMPAVSRYAVPLPTVNGFDPGISGAAMLDDTTVLFCGSIEATQDWAKDGEILGSGVGIIGLSASGRPRLLRWTILRGADGKPIREKLEGIEVLNRNGASINIRCVADNDNGTSTVLDLELRRPD